jgi:hypothetical protein
MTTLPNPMSRTEKVLYLHEIIGCRLHKSTSWPADDDEASAFWRTLEEMGLAEPVPGEKDTSRFTALGFDCGAPLASYFIGAHEPMEIPMMLEEHGLIEEEEAEAFYSSLEDEYESVLEHVQVLVRRAYGRFCGIEDIVQLQLQSVGALK